MGDTPQGSTVWGTHLRGTLCGGHTSGEHCVGDTPQGNTVWGTHLRGALCGNTPQGNTVWGTHLRGALCGTHTLNAAEEGVQR